MAAKNWKYEREANRFTEGLNTVATVYRFSIPDGATRRLKWGNFTEHVEIEADGAVLFGLTKAAVDGTTNRKTVDADNPLNKRFNAPCFYLKNSSGGARVVVVTVTLSAVAVPPNFGELTSANGFDGGDSSDAVENVA